MAENKFENLSRFAVNLNERAAQGKLDPVIGRDEEIRRVLQILSRRTKNNPILVGEPGVGKTAMSEGIAQKIVDGDIDWMLRSDHPLIQELYCKMRYQGMRPKTIVDYTREPFIFRPGNVRVTLKTAGTVLLCPSPCLCQWINRGTDTKGPSLFFCKKSNKASILFQAISFTLIPSTAREIIV